MLAIEIFSVFSLLLFNNGLSQKQIAISRQVGFQGDKFTIPDKICDRSRVSGRCSHYGAVDAPGCECLCSAANVVGTPGFFYSNGRWRCTSQKSIRTTQGCKIVMVPFESLNSELYSLKPGDIQPLSLTYTKSQAKCTVDVAKSSYMSCDGSWIPLNQNETDRFKIQKPSRGRSDKIHIKINSHLRGVNLDGRLINLGLTEECTSNINSKNRCILFKLQGTVTCPITQPRTTSQPTKQREFDKDKTTSKVGNKEMNDKSGQSSNSSTPTTPAKPTKTNQDVVFLISGGAALVAVIFVVIIIINLRRAERRNRRRAAATHVVAPAYLKPPPSHVVLVETEAVGASTNGGYTDNTSFMTGFTDLTAQSGSSGYSSDGNGTKKAVATTSAKNYEELIGEDSEEDPIYENICDKCKEMNLVGPCEHVVPYDSDDGPVYENLEEVGEGSDEEDGDKKSSDSPKSIRDEEELGAKEEDISAIQETPVSSSAVSENQAKEQDGTTDLKTKDSSQDLKSSRKERHASKHSRKRKKKYVSTTSQSKVKKQNSTDKPVKQEKQDLVGNLEQDHTNEDDVGGEHVYDLVDGSTDSDSDDHIYESVCKSSDDENDKSDGEYYNIVDLDERIAKLNGTNSSETIDSYRSNPPPLPPRPSDESTQDDSSKESKENNGKKMQPKKQQRKLRKQTTTDESTDSEAEGSLRLPPRLYDADEEKASSLGTEREDVPSLPHRLYDETEEKNTTATDVNPFLPPRLYDEEEEHISNDTNSVNKEKLTQQTNDKGEDVVQHVEKIDCSPLSVNPENETDTAL